MVCVDDPVKHLFYGYTIWPLHLVDSQTIWWHVPIKNLYPSLFLDGYLLRTTKIWKESFMLYV